MRILQINTERGWRGGERQTLLTALGLRAAGDTVELLVRAGGELEREARAQGLTVHATGGGLGMTAWLALHGGGYDILHPQTAKGMTWAVLTKFLHRARIVFTRRTSFPVGRGRWLTRLKWQLADRLVAISDASAKAPLAMGLQTVVVRSAVPPVDADPARVWSFLERFNLHGKRLVGTAAAFTREKDPVTLIRAAQRVCESHPDVVFVHWGAGGEVSDEARKAIDASGLTGRYLLAGFENRVEQLFAALSVFVMASRYEALGSSVLDAMLLHVPVVSTDAGGLRETLALGRGLTGPVGDAQIMADNIATFLDDPVVAAQMAQRAYAYMASEHDVGHMVRRYRDIYQEVVEGH